MTNIAFWIAVIVAIIVAGIIIVMLAAYGIMWWMFRRTMKEFNDKFGDFHNTQPKKW